LSVSIRRQLVCLAWLFLFAVADEKAFAGSTVYAQLEPNVSVALQDGRQLFLECRPPKGDAAKPFFEKYLADPAGWTIYKDRIGVAIRFDRLNRATQRAMLLALFKEDCVDEAGWWHTVLYPEEEGKDTLCSLCVWLTGEGTNYREVMRDKHNRIDSPALKRNQRVLIPARLLLDTMRTPTPPRPPVTTAQGSNGDEEPVDLEAIASELTYDSDKEGPYAMYRLKQGESLFTAVVVRFTDFRENADIHAACLVIQRRSGVSDVRKMKPGQKVLIPLDMLSDQFRPKGTEQREAYEQTLVEARRLRKEQVQTKDLSGIVVVVDPGHGGRDQGARNEKMGLFEDEINYDIACRVKELLETRTQARVYMTLVDPSQGYKPTSAKRFAHDTDEEVLTTPHYENNDAKISANLRWYLANAIYRAEVKKGTDSRKIVFTSFHTDALFDESLRGAMIYIPGAQYRRESEQPEGRIYDRFAEARAQRRVSTTAAERRRDEAVSRNFADDIMKSLGEHQIRRHMEGPWIRSQIRQKGGKVYVPTVLRNTMIPVKVLIEVANMTNETDCQRLADPKWRQDFAEAYVDALKSYFGS